MVLPFQASLSSRTLLAHLAGSSVTHACVHLADRQFIHTIGFTLLYLGFGIILILLVQYEHLLLAQPVFSRRGSPYRVVAWIGKFSYGIYPVNLPVGSGVANLANNHIFMDICHQFRCR